ncbi:MAG TPA: discoidin domain-containing protein, partial [Thermomicrobiales bacterium]|nr:discoidin domain-containing protein [Thermomicrobiales bacterium]
GPYHVERTIRTRNSDSGGVLLDGDASTYWLGEVSRSSREAAVILDLGSAKPIGDVRWLFAEDDFAGGMRIEVSRGRRQWTTLAESGIAAAGEWQELTLDEKVEARYVRFVFIAADGVEQAGGLAEVEVWP